MHIVWGIAVAVVSVTVATLLRWALQPLLGYTSPFILFYPAVMLSGWFGGLFPGLLATVLGATAGLIWFVQAPGIRNLQADAQFGLMLLIGGVISALTEGLYRAVRQARAGNGEANVHEAAASEADEMLRLLIEGVMDYAILILDPGGRIANWNDGARRLTGYHSSEVLGKHVSMLFSPEDQAAGVPEQELRDAVELGTVHHDRWCVRKDGTRYWATGTVTVLRSANGGIRGFVKLRRDLTDRKLVEESLRASEDRLRLTTDAVPALICYVDAQLRIRLLNRAYEDWYGKPRQSAYGKHIREVVGAAAYQQASLHIEEALAGKMVSLESVQEIRDSTRQLSVTYVPDVDCDGHVRGIVAFVNDITERKKLIAQITHERNSAENARRAAEEANRAKDAFLATVSHELRTPLTAILGWIRLLRSNDLDEATAADALDTIERNARAQARLIEDLLDMSRIASGKLLLNVQPLELSKAIEAAAESMRPAAEAKRIVLESFVLEPAIVNGDPARLQQVVWNLLSNAIKFTGEGGRVRLELTRRGAAAEISVTDTGPGISPQFLPHVFDRFRQADASTTRKFGGLGLGLSIVRHLVELHGGTVAATSAGEGKGATFSVTLPLAAARSGGGGPPLRRGERDDTPRLDGVRVLVVDDERDARNLIKQTLEGCRAEVQTAESVDAAIERFDSFRPDILISDIGMPQKDGYELIARVRKMGPERGGNVPAIALTAFARGEDRRKAMRAGFQQHISKPVEPMELATAVADLAGRKRK